MSLGSRGERTLPPGGGPAAGRWRHPTGAWLALGCRGAWKRPDRHLRRPHVAAGWGDATGAGTAPLPSGCVLHAHILQSLTKTRIANYLNGKVPITTMIAVYPHCIPAWE